MFIYASGLCSVLILGICTRKLLHIAYMYSVYVCGSIAHMWRSVSPPSNPHPRQVAPRVQTKIVRLGSKYHHLIRLAGPHLFLKSGFFSIYCIRVYHSSPYGIWIVLSFPPGNNEIEREECPWVCPRG